MDDAVKIYDLYGVGLKPKWFPVFYVLTQRDHAGITEIAEDVGLSHPAVIKLVKEMREAGVVVETKDKQDGRRNLIKLTDQGQQTAIQIQDQYRDVNQAIELALSQTRHNLWEALGEMEYLLDQQSLFERVKAQKKRREADKVTIVPYQPQHQEAFKSINEAWISQYFEMEEMDYKALDHPDTYILDKGGAILMALYEDRPAGTCALIKMDHPRYDYELAKMGVDSAYQGKGIGWLLGQATVEKAKEIGAKVLYLESNTILTPAITLYRKLGFHKVTGFDTPYARCNIQMELVLDD